MVDRGQGFQEKFMREVLNRGLNITSCQGERRFTNTFSSNLKTVNLNNSPNFGGI